MEQLVLQFFQWFWNLFGLWDALWAVVKPVWPLVWVIMKIVAILVPLMLSVAYAANAGGIGELRVHGRDGAAERRPRAGVRVAADHRHPGLESAAVAAIDDGPGHAQSRRATLVEELDDTVDQAQPGDAPRGFGQVDRAATHRPVEPPPAFR